MKTCIEWIDDKIDYLERAIFERLNSRRKKPIIEVVVDSSGVLLWVKECYGPAAGSCKTFVDGGVRYEVTETTENQFWRTKIQTVTVKVNGTAP